MSLTFVSNFLNHHQIPLSKAWEQLLCGKYRFIVTSGVPAARRKLGYADEAHKHNFVLAGNTPEAKSAIEGCDVLICGSAPEALIRKRLTSGKLAFRYAERPLKNGLEPLKYLPRLLRWHWRNPMIKPIYLLCASAYTAADYSKFGLFRGRAYKWGYFPEAKTYHAEDLMEQKDPTQILWCGRFLDWKHPDDAIRVAEKLKADGISFCLKLIGTGEMENALKRMIAEKGLGDCVHMLGSMPPEQVRQHMEKAGIFLFTSDRKEGWGAVLNESMNSGCAVVASHAIGSVPFLVKDGQNGLVYHSENVEELYQKTKNLLLHPEKQRSLGKAAYETIAATWNAEVAAERFLQLSKAILDGNKHPDLFPDGPCSKAEILKDDWYK